jgi:CheY-like chemotaxis protein
MTGKHRILVVDDEPDHLMALRMILEREESLEVVSAANAVEAEKELAKGGVDLVLLDIALPGESGIEFAHRIKGMDDYRDVPLIALSAYPDQIWKDKALEAGCVEFISKPSEPRTILEAVKATVSELPRG